MLKRAIIGALGTAFWLGIELTPPSFSAIMIIPTMAIADSVHVLMNYLLLRQKGEAREEAMVDSIRINFQPIFLTSITTAIGFGSVGFYEMRGMASFGQVLAMGVITCFLATIFVLPPLLRIFGREQTSANSFRISHTSENQAPAAFSTCSAA